MIPYTAENRADTGVSNVTMGMWLFLASDAMLFGAMFSAYAMLRVAAPVWPVSGEVTVLPFAVANTAALTAAAATAWTARAAPARSARMRLLASAALALTFVTATLLEYRGDVAAGFVPGTSTFLALYFTLTGLHALHVLGGAAANIWVAAGAARLGPAMTRGRARALSLFWVFQSLIWLALFVMLYLS
jgi:heme/copper-type cytochrome/quinol oxidase subunit 3